MTDSLGDRMKAYEGQETHPRFLPNVPVVARIDGRCFSKFTKGFERPFDELFGHVMRSVTAHLVRESGANLGYTQSDEISLCWYNPTPGSDIFFGGRKFKMTAQLAALATAYFHIECNKIHLGAKAQQQVPTFDARVFQVPNLEEGVNTFLWRQRDCRKNAISMIARSYFSHKALLNKSGRDMIEMLAEKGVLLGDYSWRYTEGTFIRREVVSRSLTMEELDRIPEEHRPNPGEEVQRSVYVECRFPLFSDVENATDVVFFGKNPIQKVSNGTNQSIVG